VPSDRRDIDDQDWLAERFEQYRPRLRAVSYRMLGSLSEADDAVQDAWLRLSRADTGQVDDLGAWLTTVVARICLDALRSRNARREVPSDPQLPDPIIDPIDAVDPEHEALIADSVGLALLVVLETLGPSERLAVVLHDIFDIPFDQIAPIVGRSEPATRQLASRARRRLRAGATPNTDLASQWRVVDAFLAAARDGDFEALLNVLDPDVVRRFDAGALRLDAPRILRGAKAVASGALTFQKLGFESRRVLVNGAPGVIALAGGKPVSVAAFTVADGKITELNVLADPARLRRLDLSLLAPQHN
jgi:RNA polymerase sigma-70 factor (ECF subfamily)